MRVTGSGTCSVGGGSATPLSDLGAGVMLLALLGLVVRRRSR